MRGTRACASVGGGGDGEVDHHGQSCGQEETVVRGLVLHDGVVSLRVGGEEGLEERKGWR